MTVPVAQLQVPQILKECGPHLHPQDPQVQDPYRPQSVSTLEK